MHDICGVIFEIVSQCLLSIRTLEIEVHLVGLGFGTYAKPLGNIHYLSLPTVFGEGTGIQKLCGKLKCLSNNSDVFDMHNTRSICIFPMV